MVVAIIPARGGSKGIPKKNLIDICGKPLMAWSIEQAVGADSIDETYVSSDSDEILSVAKSFGAGVIKRPDEIAGSTASSESAWIHALEQLEAQGKKIEYVVMMQATSPIRHSSDLNQAVKKMRDENLDSLFSAANIGDFFIWKKEGANYQSINYDYQNRKRRQDFGEQILENGSFYICKPELLKQTKNRLSGKIGIFEMPFWKSFEIDEPENIKFVSMVMKNYLLAGEH
jgi:N-acylneuraminate cytidylyltransferase